MSRAHIYKVFENADGSVIVGQTVRVLDPDTSDPVTDSLYTTDAGSSTRSNPFTADDGKVEFYLDISKRVRLGITPVGGSEFFVVTDVYPRADGVVTAAVDNLSLGTPVEGYIPIVNGSGQFDYVDPSTIGDGGALTVNSQSGASYQLVVADCNGRTVVETTSSSAVSVVVPPNATAAIPVGSTVEVCQVGTGQVTVTPGAGVTVNSAGGRLKTAEQYAMLTLRKRATNSWIVAGDTTT